MTEQAEVRIILNTPDFEIHLFIPYQMFQASLFIHRVSMLTVPKHIVLSPLISFLFAMLKRSRE